MSAFIAVKYEDRVELLTDGAIYREDGTLTDIRRKVWTADKVPLVIAGRGNSAALAGFAIMIVGMANGSGSFDATIKWLTGILAERAGQELKSGAEIVVAGISETLGPMIYYATTNSYTEGVPAWTLFDAGDELVGGNQIDPESLGLSVNSFADGLNTHGAAVMDAMRQKAGLNPTKPSLSPVYGIGGHVDHTVVSTTGVTVERIHEWPEDKVGKKIEPFAERLAA